MAAITDEELEQEFGIFGVNLDDLVVTDKLKEISSLYKWSAARLVEEWVAYSSASSEPSLESVEQFKRKISSDQRSRSQIGKISKNEKAYSKSSVQEIITDKDVSILEMYQTPETKTSIKRLHTTPESGNKMLHTLTGRTPTTFSPASISPVSATPAKRYEARENAGEVALTYNPGGVLEKDINWKGHHSNLEINYVSKPLTEKFKYMFQKILDKSQVLSDYIDKMASLLKKAHKIEEFASILSMHQEDVTVVGRVGCDTNGKLNASSLILRESGSSSSGHSISLNVAEVNQFSLFPGQVVAVIGKNATGMQFIASSFYEGLLPQPHISTGSHTDITNLSIFIAVGPFTTSESDSYEPLSDFLNQVLKEDPDLVIMIGPFVDSKHEMIQKCQLNETFDELFARKMNSIGECAKRLSKKFIIIPSQRDVNHELVYPQPPFVANDIINTLMFVMLHKNKMRQNVNYQKERENVTKNIGALHFVSDPCTVEINGCTLGLTSTDVLFQMAGEEISCPPGSSDKMGRLVKHILTQQCYYPMYPPSENVCVDYEVYSQHACVPCKPDVLIVPSELRYFVKNVMGCLSVNPGRLTKGLVGGTYCRILLKKDPSLQDAVDRSVVQIVRI